ncbi:MAG: META domain-containing protein [Anaerolineae bacterium]|nr:META domain-containing protein [Candidatus Roseilinea sp.]MDW8450033.1 META domain-containing protein [Anaerolineae bacterium]
MQKTKITTVLSFGAAALSLAACALPPAPPPRQPASRIGATGLAGSSWVLESLNGRPPLAEATITLNFEVNRVNGSDGCNRFMGGYTLDGFNIAFGQLAGTLMACPEPVMKQAADFQQALANARSFSVAEGRLTLLDEAGNAIATFVVQETDLAGTMWTVLSYNNGKQAVVSVITGTELTVMFDAEGRIGGNAGCNNFTGPYKTEDGGKITIGPLASTRKLCNIPEGVMEQEAQFLAALETAATYRIEGDRLQLRTADGAMAANFQRAK